MHGFEPRLHLVADFLALGSQGGPQRCRQGCERGVQGVLQASRDLLVGATVGFCDDSPHLGGQALVQGRLHSTP
eukprot:7334181-Pyramimonas_sp.AAC.1